MLTAGRLASEADCISDQDQVFGKIAPTGGASLDIRQASLEILVFAYRQIDTPGTAPCRQNNRRIEIKTVSRSAEAAAPAHKVP